MTSLDFNLIQLAGSHVPISQAELREAQISLCQHAPSVNGGIEGMTSLSLMWAILQEQISFESENELELGAPLPSYRQMIAHLDLLNKSAAIGADVPAPVCADCDMVLSVKIGSGIQWLLAAVTDGYISFTCLPTTKKRLDSGTILLFAT